METQTIKTGCSHFAGEYRKYKRSGYNVIKAMCEFVDNIITKCSNINISIETDSDNIIHQIKISDDYSNGFENICSEGTDNPFNMTHMRPGQDLDSETSQFGIGMKAGAISLAKKMNIYTNVDNSYLKIILDFEAMCKIKDPVASFDFQLIKVSKSEFNKYHPFDYGSTIILEQVRKHMFTSDFEDDIVKLRNNLSEIYSNMIDIYNTNIYVNNEKLVKSNSFFDHDNCKLFNRKIHIYEVSNHPVEDYYIEFNDETFKFDHSSNTFKKEKTPFKELDLNYTNVFSNDQTHCAIMECTFTRFHPYFNCAKSEQKSDLMPRNKLIIYRDGRKYGDWKAERTNNGSHNYTDMRLLIKSKKLLTELGLSFNKNIAQSHDYLISKVIKAAKKKITRNFNGDSSTKDYNKFYETALSNNIIIHNDLKPSHLKKKEKEEKHENSIKAQKGGIVTQLQSQPQPQPQLKPQPQPPTQPPPATLQPPPATLQPHPLPPTQPPPATPPSPPQLQLQPQPQLQLQSQPLPPPATPPTQLQLQPQPIKGVAKKIAEKTKQNKETIKLNKELETQMKTEQLRKAIEKQKIDKEKHLNELNYQSWKLSAYFGVLECDRFKGIAAPKDIFTCHFGITNDDPNHRDSGSGLGTKWRRMITMNMNDIASKTNNGKREIEWIINRELTQNFSIEWLPNSNEYFYCNKSDFKSIYLKIISIMSDYAAEY